MKWYIQWILYKIRIIRHSALSFGRLQRTWTLAMHEHLNSVLIHATVHHSISFWAKVLICQKSKIGNVAPQTWSHHFLKMFKVLWNAQWVVEHRPFERDLLRGNVHHLTKFQADIWTPCRIRTATSSHRLGSGITTSISSFILSIFQNCQTLVIYWTSCSYRTGIAVGQLLWQPSRIHVIQWLKQVHLSKKWIIL